MASEIPPIFLKDVGIYYLRSVLYYLPIEGENGNGLITSLIQSIRVPTGKGAKKLDLSEGIEGIKPRFSYFS